MTSRFDTCLQFVLDREGRTLEYDPHDPGGVTYCGIDQRDHPGVDVRKLDMGGVAKIYHELWDKIKGDELFAPWDLLVFDSAVNPGLGFAVRAMQECLAVKSDGIIGPRTLNAARSNSVVTAPFNAAIKCFLNKRSLYYAHLPLKLRKYFIDGWNNRVALLGQEVGLKLANGVVA